MSTITNQIILKPRAGGWFAVVLPNSNVAHSVRRKRFGQVFGFESDRFAFGASTRSARDVVAHALEHVWYPAALAGSSVDVPNPQRRTGDAWKHPFRGTVVGHKGGLLIQVQDQDGDVFDIEYHRVTMVRQAVPA